MAQSLTSRSSGEIALSRFDSILLNGAASGKSPDELSRLVGGTLNPAQCKLRVTSILADRNVWTMIERKQLLLHQLQELSHTMKEQFQQSGDTNDAALLLKTLGQVASLLDKQGSVSDDELDRANKSLAKEIVAFVSGAFKYASEELGKIHPELPIAVIEEKLYEGLAYMSEADDDED